MTDTTACRVCGGTIETSGRGRKPHGCSDACKKILRREWYAAHEQTEKKKAYEQKRLEQARAATQELINTRTFECVHPSCDEALTYSGAGRYPTRCEQHKTEYRTEQQRLSNLAYVRISPAPQCSDEECDRDAHSRGMCKLHYKRWARSEGMINSPSEGWTRERKANWRKRKALKRGAQRAETIYHDSIFRRDNYICQLCMKPVNPALAYPDPFSASLDHRIPVVDGGNHTRDNVQCSHLRCNLSKGRKREPRLSEA